MAISKKPFGALPDGREATLYTLQNQGSTVLEVTDYGCRIHRLWAADKSGQLGDVVLGHRTLPEYFGDNYQGAGTLTVLGKPRFAWMGRITPWPQTMGKTIFTAGLRGTIRCCGRLRPRMGPAPASSLPM